MGFRINRGIFQFKDGESYVNKFKIDTDGQLKEVDSNGNPVANTLGTAATAAAGDFATAAQGTTADAALPKAGGTVTGTLILSGANLGIGTTNPVTGLDVRPSDNYGTPTARFGEISPLYIINNGGAFIGFNQYNANGWKAGSSGRSGYIGVDSVNGGMYFGLSTQSHAADEYTEAKTHLYIKNNGWIGIGNTLPYAPLHVYNQSEPGTDTPFMVESLNPTTWMTIGSPSGSWAMGAGEGNKFMLRQVFGPQAPRMIIDSSGNVGIGTSSPNEKLHVSGSLHLHDEEGDTDASILLTTGTSNVTTTVLASNGTSYLNGGNVGIGTTTPGYKLDVNGTLRSSDITIADYVRHEGDTNSYIGFLDNDNFRVVLGGITRFEATTGSTYINTPLWIPDKISHSGDSNTYMSFPSNDTINFYTNGLERMRILPTGNIGIGMNSPSEKLTVYGNRRI